jgi:hypothetical protein
MKNLNWDILCFWVGFVTIASVITLALYSHGVKKDELFAKNLETAIGKGIDPIAVKCSYSEIKTEMCITYILAHK